MKVGRRCLSFDFVYLQLHALSWSKVLTLGILWVRARGAASVARALFLWFWFWGRVFSSFIFVVLEPHRSWILLGIQCLMYDSLGLPLASLLLEFFLFFIFFLLFFVLIIVVFIIIDIFEGLPVSSAAMLLMLLLVSHLLLHICDLLNWLILNDPVLNLLHISLMAAMGCSLHLVQELERLSMTAFIQHLDEIQ